MLAIKLSYLEWKTIRRVLFDNSKIYLHWKVIAGCNIHSVGELFDGDTKRGSVNVLAES